ncbi:MAG: DUF4097 family beta strand repeat protein [Gemmatimonadaceae bacterium]|nr:DUF4097 family beta strand repeat protein [Gemmatimonadaceae bacterium]
MPRLIRFILAFVVLASLVPGKRAAAQTDDAEWLDNCRRESDRGWNNRRETHCEIREASVRAPRGTVTMEGLRNGGVHVTGWDRDQMVVRTRIRAQARSSAAARALASRVRTVINGSTITAEGPSDNEDEESWSASLVVSLPRRSDLRVGTRNGPVSVEQVRGEMNLETRNGPLSLRDLAGTVKARTTNGPLSISLTGNRWEGEGLDAKTTNGPLTISIPEGYSAHLEAGTTNGPISLGFPVTVVGRINKNISTDLGSGGATVRAETTNGPLTIRRR